MFRIVRAKNLRDLEEAVYTLRALVVDQDPNAGDGCDACGKWMADVATPNGGTYCWKCCRRLDLIRYTVFPGREVTR